MVMVTMAVNLENPIAPAPAAGNAPHGRASSMYSAMAREKAHKAQDMRNKGRIHKDYFPPLAGFLPRLQGLLKIETRRKP